jgi:prepilin-type N-terminal cleavage/methylation domain-containing protein
MTGESDDTGFSLVEVVIAMFLFLVIATALLPLTVSAVTLSAGNRDLTAANSLASSRLADLRGTFPDGSPTNSCAAVRATTNTDQADPASTGLVSDLAIGTCPTTYPGTVVATVTVRESGHAGSLVEIPTRILVAVP